MGLDGNAEPFPSDKPEHDYQTEIHHAPRDALSKTIVVDPLGSNNPRGLKRTAATAAAFLALAGCNGPANLVQPSDHKNDANDTVCQVIVWINAFIDPTTTDPSYITIVQPPSPDATKPAVIAPWMADLVGPERFLTDNRGPVATIGASARMRSEARFTITNDEAPLLTEAFHVMGTSVGIEHNSLTNSDRTVCRLPASAAGMSWGGPQVSGTTATGRTTAVTLRGSAKDACIVAINPITGNVFRDAPPIDYKGNLIITNYGSFARVRFVGVVDHYPSFEMYVRDSNARTARILYQPNIGRNPSYLATDTLRLVPVDNAVNVCLNHDQGGG